MTQTTWQQISDPNPTEYREHELLAVWESADGSERIEHQRSEHGEGHYRYSVAEPDSGEMFDTFAEASAPQFTQPVRCTACGETCEYGDAKHDQGYVYCPACVAADPELQ